MDERALECRLLFIGRHQCLQQIFNRVDPLVARSRHADLVESAVAAENSVQTDSEIVLSWRRCSSDYHVDPRSTATPHIITQTELALFKEPVSDVLLHAREEIRPPLCHCPARRLRRFAVAIAKESPSSIVATRRRRSSSTIGASGWAELVRASRGDQWNRNRDR